MSDCELSTFDAFWNLYPRKKGKGAARKAWDRAVTLASPADIMAGLENQLSELKSREPQYRPYPSTWLHQERWEDEPDEQPAPNIGIPNYRQSEETVQRILAERARKNAANGR